MKNPSFKTYRLLVPFFLFSFLGINTVSQATTGLEAAYTQPAQTNSGGEGEFSFFISPNPFSGGALALNFKNISTGKTRLTMFSLVGKEVFAQNIPIAISGDFTTTVDLPDTIPAGSYLVKIDSNNASCTKMLIIRKGP